MTVDRFCVVTAVVVDFAVFECVVGGKLGGFAFDVYF